MVYYLTSLKELANLTQEEKDRLQKLAESYLVQTESWTGEKFWESTYTTCGVYGSYKLVRNATLESIIATKRNRVIEHVRYSRYNTVHVHYPRKYLQYFTDEEIAELEKDDGVEFNEDGIDIITRR